MATSSPNPALLATAMADPEKKKTDLIIMGKTGHGKSSTANTIVGYEAFDSSDSATSDTFSIQNATATRGDRQITVVDTPGLAETRMKPSAAAEKMVDDMTKGIAFCLKGYNAIILVLKYGNRFTQEELQSVGLLKVMLGENFLRDFGLIIFTHGDVFKKKNKKMRFIDWCKAQKGALKEILEECNFRVVLFDNDEQQDKQLDTLFEIVDGFKGERYTNARFKSFAFKREQMLVKQNADALIEKNQIMIDDLSSRAEVIKQDNNLSEAIESKIAQLCEDGEELSRHILEQDKSTGVLVHLRKNIRAIQKDVEVHKKELHAKELERKAKEETALQQQKLEDAIEELKKEKLDQEEMRRQMFSLIEKHNEESIRQRNEMSELLSTQQQEFLERIDAMAEKHEREQRERLQQQEEEEERLRSEMEDQREKIEELEKNTECTIL